MKKTFSCITKSVTQAESDKLINAFHLAQLFKAESQRGDEVREVLMWDRQLQLVSVLLWVTSAL